MGKNKVAQNGDRKCFLKFLTIFCLFGQVLEGGRSALGEAVAHAPPARRAARSTPRGYAPLEFSGNGCLQQPMRTFFYCDSYESQQRGKTPRVKVTFMHFKMNTL